LFHTLSTSITKSKCWLSFPDIINYGGTNLHMTNNILEWSSSNLIPLPTSYCNPSIISLFISTKWVRLPMYFLLKASTTTFVLNLSYTKNFCDQYKSNKFFSYRWYLKILRAKSLLSYWVMCRVFGIIPWFTIRINNKVINEQYRKMIWEWFKIQLIKSIKMLVH
jgi:hypothetical protein